MTWPCTHHAKIFGRLDQSCPKNLRPHAIHCHSRGERIRRTNGPSRKRQTIERRSRWQARQEMRHARAHALRACAERATCENVSICQRGRFRADELDVATLGEAVKFPVQRRKLGFESQSRPVELIEEVLTDRMHFVFRPFRNWFAHNFRDIVRIRQVCSLIGGKFSLIKAKILKPGLPEWVAVWMRAAEFERSGRARGVFQSILHHRQVLRHTIDIEAHTGGFTRTIVGCQQVVPPSDLQDLVRGLNLNRLVRQLVGQHKRQLPFIRNELPSPAVLIRVRAREDHAIWQAVVLGFIRTQMWAQPGSHAEGFRAVFTPNLREFQIRTGLHAHERPEPRTLTPHHRRSRGRRKFSPYSRRGILEQDSFLLVKAEPHNQAF